MTYKLLAIGLTIALGILAVSAWPEIRAALPSRSSTITNQVVGDYDHGRIEFSDTDVTVLIPLTASTQAKGLAGRTGLSDREGMLWLYSDADLYTFWMKGMLIPLDFIWLRSSRVAEITPAVPAPAAGEAPQVIKPSLRVDAVLEVAAGFAQRHSVEVGDMIRLVR